MEFYSRPIFTHQESWSQTNLLPSFFLFFYLSMSLFLSYSCKSIQSLAGKAIPKSYQEYHPIIPFLETSFSQTDCQTAHLEVCRCLFSGSFSRILSQAYEFCLTELSSFSCYDCIGSCLSSGRDCRELIHCLTTYRRTSLDTSTIRKLFEAYHRSHYQGSLAEQQNLCFWSSP